MLLVILGRTGTGKTTLSKMLEQRGAKVAKTHTTRPRRTANEDSHFFITPEEAAAFGEKNKAAVTKIGDFEYFTSKEELDNCNVIILDPLGLADLIHRVPRKKLCVLYLVANEDQRRRLAISRADNPEKEIEIYRKRTKAEHEQFYNFELELMRGTVKKHYGRVQEVYTFVNCFKKDEMERFADFLIRDVW